MPQSVESAANSAALATGRPAVAGRSAAMAQKEFLTFRLGAQEYGIDARTVRQIRGCAALEGIGDAPECVAGAIDFGGAMVPVVDLRHCFGLDRVAGSIFTVAFMLDLDTQVLGVKVDSVSDVVRLARRQIRPAPATWTGPDVQYVVGVGVDDDRNLILLDIEKLLLDQGVGLLEIEAC